MTCSEASATGAEASVGISGAAGGSAGTSVAAGSAGVLPNGRTALEQGSSKPKFWAVLVARLLEVAECLNRRYRHDEIHRDGHEVMSAGTRIEREDGTSYLQTIMFPNTPWNQGLEHPVDGSVQASFGVGQLWCSDLSEIADD
ncbi:hypothetical protein PC119_g25876 [Phytophthora cactorum]|uniref:Uncharacterized protein n=1 Tax=Phytophthora cactorum TaxID=29920 RepID=A0A8T1E3J2_9STRA|nr:hypothetical protein PC117_g6336 [Phytophthora cactorum]KAG2962206.1 hypothetical protein PC119_g25876 [Phytophthora cactorum]